MRVGAGGGGGERVKREVCALVEKLVQSQDEVGLSELSSGLSNSLGISVFVSIVVLRMSVADRLHECGLQSNTCTLAAQRDID